MKLDGTVALPLQRFVRCAFHKGVLMLDIKRIRIDFDAVAEKLATRGVDAAVLNEMKEIDAKTS